MAKFRRKWNVSDVEDSSLRSELAKEFDRIVTEGLVSGPVVVTISGEAPKVRSIGTVNLSTVGAKDEE